MAMRIMLTTREPKQTPGALGRDGMRALALALLMILAMGTEMHGETAEALGTEQNGSSPPREQCTLCGCCMSFVTKTRTARTVGKGRLCLSLKVQEFDYDEKLNAQDAYHDLGGDDKYQRLGATLSLKYGWARNHHLCLSVPVMMNDIDIGGTDIRNSGLGNVAVAEKWNFIEETARIPAVAVDAWYIFGTGNSQKKLGTSDPACKLTCEISKTWEQFSLHLNPGYKFNQGPNTKELNAALLLTPWKHFWPAVEYNYASTGGKGRKHDIVPCFIYKFHPGACWKIGLVINVASTTTYRDRFGLVTKLSYTW